MPHLDIPFDYIVGTRVERCRVRLWERPEHTVVLATESHDLRAPADDITGAAEAILTQLATAGHVRQPGSVLFIEHVDQRRLPPERRDPDCKPTGEHFEIVAFARLADQFSDPDWSPTTRANVEILVDQCLS